ncbi:MAG: hypothetical protein JWM95_2415 [Gemmatimonadetes bacterium]|nr:hypothetical protein [Gemmatimonadota bacterium]
MRPSAEIAADVDRMNAQDRALAERHAALVRDMEALRLRRDGRVADGATADELVGLNRDVLALREDMESVNGGRAVITKRKRALHVEHSFARAAESVSEAADTMRAVDASVFACAGSLVDLLPRMTALVNEARQAELQAAAVGGPPPSTRGAVWDVVGTRYDGLADVAAAVQRYASTRESAAHAATDGPVAA